MTQISSHILDTALGKPAAGVVVTLQQQHHDEWLMLGSANTDEDGRISDFTGVDEPLPGGTYRLTFYIGEYHERLGTRGFYPQADVTFEIEGGGQHYHVPLLVNPYGYSTYRGS